MNNFRSNGNITDYNKYKDNFELVTSYITLIRLLIECGGGSDISRYLTLINDIIGDCNCGCDDDDDQFSRVTGWGSLVGADGTDGTNGTNGTNGAAGADGSNGTQILVNNIVVDTPSVGAFATLKSYTLPLNTLEEDGDAIEVKAIIESTDSANIKTVKVLIGGADAMPKKAAFGFLAMLANYPYMEVNFTVTRKSATTIFITYNVPIAGGTPYFFGDGFHAFYEPSITVNDLTSLANIIDIQGFTTSPDTIVCKQLMVKFLKKS
jgi:hypothetical protein